MRLSSAVASLALASGVAAGAIAHEGHEHKLMGTVKAVAEDHLVVEKDGVEETIHFDENTRFQRGSDAAESGSAQVGERVVVFYTVKAGQKQASRVLLPAETKEGTSP